MPQHPLAWSWQQPTWETLSTPRWSPGLERSLWAVLLPTTRIEFCAAPIIPAPPHSWFHSERFCFRSLASGSPSSKPLLTREVSPAHSHQHAGWIHHPQAVRFLNCGKGVSPFSCLPQRGGQPMDTPQPQRKGNKASLRTRYWFNKEFAGIHQVLKPDFSLHEQTIWRANHLGNPGYQRLHQGTSLENWHVFLKGQLKRNP